MLYPPGESVRWHSGVAGAPRPRAQAQKAEPGLAPQTYDIQGSLQKDSQVTVSIVLENQSSSFLKNMELNVLDSLNTRLARPEGSSVHDGVPVPFQLPPGTRAARQDAGAPTARAAVGPRRPPFLLSPAVPGSEPGFPTRAGSAEGGPWVGFRHCPPPLSGPALSPSRRLQ